MTKNNDPLDRPAHTVHTGIDIQPLMPGLVPVFDEMTACQAEGYKYFDDWQELNPQERAFHVAHFVTRNLIEGHKNDAQVDKAIRDSKKKKK